MFPRTSRSSSRVRVSRGSLGVSVFVDSNPNNRSIGAACSTIHVARVPANVIIDVRSRGDRVRGHTTTLHILGDHLLTVGRRRRTTRTTSVHRSRIHSLSHSRQVHACGFPRGHVISRHAGCGTCGLSTILSNSLRTIVSDSVRTSRTSHLTRRGWEQPVTAMFRLIQSTSTVLHTSNISAPRRSTGLLTTRMFNISLRAISGTVLVKDRASRLTGRNTGRDNRSTTLGQFRAVISHESGHRPLRRVANRTPFHCLSLGINPNIFVPHRRARLIIRRNIS